MSAIATARSTALAAAIPATNVSGAVATARIASPASPSVRERGDVPDRLALERGLGDQEQRRAAEREDGEAERRVVAGMGDRELVADGDPDQSTISVSVQASHHPTATAPWAVSATSTPIASDAGSFTVASCHFLATLAPPHVQADA